ncbi:unnamed protein product [Medioppia subpectinata]|uniref:Methyltransferase type 11 domain-containing protein n=1 Tax=Medioppia subpectinata TaxID=1979941 RepID=A0A7R9PV86_9ACAR|nr:unnamed protein product [Medioppia subpectinata]CAG2102349.1 unnamed protein product [Medioppia subpectinata]
MSEQSDQKRQQLLDNLFHCRDVNETKDFYAKWANDYEEDIRDMEYNGAQIVVKCFLELNCPLDCRILDIGAGTGVIGTLLKKHGYTNIDGLDASPKMLEIAREKDCYVNLINSIVANNIRLPIDSKSYDVVIMAGVFCPGHISVDAFNEILRVTKPGGTICWAMGVEKTYVDYDDQYRDGQFERAIVTLCDRLKWLSILGYPKRVDNYLHGKDGWFHAMQVI